MTVPSSDASAARGYAFVRRMVGLNLVALLAAYMSGHWDAAMHAQGAVEEFWYPPHYGIYFGLATAAGVSAVGLAILLRGPGRIGAKVRRDAALATVVAANAIGFSGAPLDAWWHETFGIDLSVWSPPHLHLLFGMVLAAFAGSVYFLSDAARGPRTILSMDRREAVAAGALVVGLLLAAFLFFEYEAGLPNAEVLARPAWTYPVLWTAFCGLAVAVPAGLLRIRGAATLVASAYVLARIAVLYADRGLLGFEGAVPYPLVVPALAFDASLVAAGARGRDPFRPPALVGAGILAGLSVVLSAPAFWSAVGIVPPLVVAPWADAWPLAVLAGVVGVVAGWALGAGLRRLRPLDRPERAAGPTPEAA